MNGRKIIVKGRVQGVFFRQAIFETVTELLPTVSGYVKNLPTGDVEILAFGTDQELDRVELIAHKGSPMSRVDSLHVEKLETIDSLPTTFRISY